MPAQEVETPEDILLDARPPGDGKAASAQAALAAQIEASQTFKLLDDGVRGLVVSPSAHYRHPVLPSS